MERKMLIQYILVSLVLMAIIVSAMEMLNGNEERGVLFCLWVSLLIGLYGVSK